MSYFQTLKAGVCLSALVMGQAAAADVTAQDVWDNWKSWLTIYGEDGVTIASESMSGDTLTVSGLVLSMDDDVSSMSADIGDMQFTENGDGTVTITMAPTSTITIDDENDVTVTMSTRHSGMSIIASGTPDAMNYDLKADQYGLTIDSIEDPNSDVDGEFSFTMNDLTGSYLVEAMGDLRDVTYVLNTGSLDMLADFTEAQTDTQALLSGKVNGLFVDAKMTLPMDMDLEDPEAFLRNDFAVTATYGLQDGNYLFDITENGQQGQGTVTTGSADVAVDFSAQGIGYNVLTKAIEMNLSFPSEMPFPVTASIDEYGINLELPLAKSEEAQDFGFGINLTELAINDEIWMLGDPTGAIPHDPVTFKLDLSGTAKVLVDLFNPEEMAAVDAGQMMPGELYSLDLNDLTVIAAGASVDGAGGFTFDNSDLTTIPGVPRPEGEVTVNINGANKLIDSLVAMGLLPEDQAMMGRMMMGMFARTVGDDQLTSTIEINDQGHILANGQRIQ